MKTVNRLLTVVVSVALIAFGVVLAVEVGAALFGAPPLLVDWRGAYDAGRTDSWSSNPVRVVASVVTAVGLLLLLAQLKPRRVSRLAVSTDDRYTDAAVTRAGVRGALRRAAENVDGISGAKVRLGRRRAKVVASTRAGETGLREDLTADIRTAVIDRLTSLELTRPLRVHARVQSRKAQS